jgi:hypothetical protein
MTPAFVSLPRAEAVEFGHGAFHLFARGVC